MRRLVTAASLFSIVLAASCGKSAMTMTGDDDMPVDAGAPGFVGTKYSLQWGPVTVPANTENTQCVILKLANADAIKVHQMHNVLTNGSHHMIVYRDDMDTTESPTPFNCQPFTGALNPTGMVSPMMITQKKDDPLTLPTGVAYTLNANQMVRLELHYINTTDADEVIQGNVDFFAADPATITDEANILFLGTPDVSLPPNTMTTIEEFFSPSNAGLDLSTSKFFAITGHEHHLGTQVTIATEPTSGGAKTTIYDPDPFQWAEPATTTFSPEFTVPAAGGFDFKCDYYNSTAATVKFGESANDEMCFFWAYYYPSKGAHVCIHTNQIGNADICCPADPSNQLSVLACSKLSQN